MQSRLLLPLVGVVVLNCGGSNVPEANSATATSATGSSSAAPQATDSQPSPVTLGAAFAVSDFGIAGNTPAGDTCTPSVLGSKLARLDCGSWAITLEVANAMNDATVDGAKDTSTKAWSGAKNFKSQTLADGWQLTFEATDNGAPQYHLKTYRTIAGRAYACDITAKAAAERDKAIAVCGSLKAKPK
jgi:hypothetical protein